MTENNQAEKSVPIWPIGAGVGAGVGALLGIFIMFFVGTALRGGKYELLPVFFCTATFGFGGMVGSLVGGKGGSNGGWIKGLVVGTLAALGLSFSLIVIGAIILFLFGLLIFWSMLAP